MQRSISWLSFSLCITLQLLLLTMGTSLKPFTTVVQVVDKNQHSVFTRKNYIYGNTKHEVNVYVKVHSNSPFLVCMDLGLSQREVIDPNALWIGPDGQHIERQSYVNLTATGKLMLLRFNEGLSGPYTCTLSYKVIKEDMQAEEERFKAYKFMVYAYREPNYTYRVFVHFTTRQCDSIANGEFYKEVVKVMNLLISHLTCQIIDSSYRCHTIKRPKHGLSPELYVSFQVNPFGPGWESVCQQTTADCEYVTNKRIQEARWLIAEFFQKQPYFLKHVFQNTPAIHYIDNSFQVVRLESCHPGFGKNDAIHYDCLHCCVACEPGTYSPNHNVVCLKCTSIRIKFYGAISC